MCQTIVCFISVGRTLIPEMWYAYILVEGMPIQMYGETQYVDLQVRTIMAGCGMS